MSNILHVYISKEIIISTYHKIITILGKNKLLENLEVCALPEKLEILELKQQIPTDLPEFFKKFDTLILPGILIHNNIHYAHRDHPI